MRALSPRNLRGSSNGLDLDSSSRARFNSSAGTRYDVLDRASEGTLFVTYRVRDKNLDRVLALKALKSAFSKNHPFALALTQGASQVLDLEHPGLAQLLEIGKEEGTTFLVTEWLFGQSLEARLRRAPFGRIEALTSTRQIAEGLQFLHDNGLTHGDLRPRQVLGSGDGILKLTDACLAGAFSAAGLSIVDVQQDSIYYLAPERTVANTHGDAPSTISSDLYALGAILYRMLSGRVPFAGPSPVAVAMRHRHDEPLPPSRFNPQCPKDLEEIAMQLLAKEPEQRFASAQEVLEALLPQNKTVIATPESLVALGESVSENAAEIPGIQATSASPQLDTETDVNLQPTGEESSLSVALAAATSDTPTPSKQGTSPQPDLFPANLPITALAATPLAQLTATNAATGVAADSASVSAAGRGADTTTNVAMNTKNTPSAKASAPLAAPTVVSASAVNAVTPNAASNQVPPTSIRSVVSPNAIDEKAARKKQRRREFWGALLALLWVFVGVGIFIGILYGAYKMWENSAPKDVRVPTYIGLNEARAKQALSKAGLTLDVRGEVFNPKQPAGTIVSGDPRPGRMVKAGRTVMVTISRGAEQIAMPDLSDLDLQRARQILSRSGMRIGNVTEIYHDRVARGYVAGQFPLAGEAFSRSEPINLVISRGPQPSDNTQASSDLLPPPPPPSTSTSTEDNPLSAAPPTTSTQNSRTPLVSRTVLIRVPVPAKSGATARTVKIVVRDASGDTTIYEESHVPGELIDEYVRVTRPQGGTATISIYIDGELQKQQKV